MRLGHGKRAKPRPRFLRRTHPGATPGTVVVDPAAPHPVVRVVSLGAGDLIEEVVEDLDALADLVAQKQMTWVDVQGLGDAQTINRLGEIFGLHPLALEDVVNTHQRAKVEDYGEHLFVVARMLRFVDRLDTEQISLFVGENFVLTFQEKPGDCLDPVRKRIRNAEGRLRNSGPDYLAYALLDAVVDAYFPILEQYGDWLDKVDDEVSAQAGRQVTVQIHGLRSDLLLLRRAIWPLRDAVAELAREPNRLISEETRLYFRDCYDHTVQIIDLVETCREQCSDLRDYYLSMVNNRMSEVMKVLTIIATIFIPLGFIAGLYGMNFDPSVSKWNMPELRWHHGYPFALAVMAAVAGGLLLFFWRRGWLKS
jgi:magnesium transporter